MSALTEYHATSRIGAAPVITVKDTYPGPDPKWQVIFTTFTGLDYCRETKGGKLPLEYIKAWATLQCYEHNLAGARIERW
ncbi:hypothetical protein [Cupriavidus sp. DL-D2]|uniref:hypothetical protein n=1 Tax=Cupriavidus sp. DL-D2 TaxID=3144974 RepID=UPI003212BC7F